MTLEELYPIYQKHSTICTDSRKVTPDCLFFALKGDNFDGNKFAQQAIAEGAAYAVIDDASRQENNSQYILVKDALKTLQALANFHRQKFDIPIIAITGSNGKTTTKELVSLVMDSQYILHYTKGNFNNHIGVPLTLLAMPTNTEVAIIEMGANHVGEIAALCQIAAPTHGLITNVGNAHLEGFGGFEGVMQGKGELYRFLEENGGVAFVNTDEDNLLEMAGWSIPKIFYSRSTSLDLTNPGFESQLIEHRPFIKIGFLNKDGDTIIANTQLMGIYNFNNIMTAVAIGKYFKVPTLKIKKAIESYLPSNNRSQLKKIGNNTFLLDAYNANPTSMEQALESFASDEAAKKVAILGDMLELGVYSMQAHRDLLFKAAHLGMEVLTVGEEFRKVANDQYQTFKDVQELKAWFEQQNFENTFFLLKGSRGMRLESLISNIN